MFLSNAVSWLSECCAVVVWRVLCGCVAGIRCWFVFCLVVLCGSLVVVAPCLRMSFVGGVLNVVLGW